MNPKELSERKFRSRVCTRLFRKKLERELDASIVLSSSNSEGELDTTFIEPSSNFSPSTNSLIATVNSQTMPPKPSPKRNPPIPTQEQIASFITSSISTEVNQVMSNLEDRLLVRLTDSMNSIMSARLDQAESSTSAQARARQNIPNENVERRPVHRLEMSKWNLHFSGDDSGLRIDQFLGRVEHIAITQGFTFDEVCKNIYIFFSGRASSWYFEWIKSNFNSTWCALRHALLEHFRSPETDSEIEHQLYNRMQRFSESFTQYFYVMTDLNSKMRNPRTDADLIEILKRNVNSKLMMMIHNSSTTNLSKFLNECRSAETKLQRIESRSQFKPKVNELESVNETLPEDDDFEIEALRKPSFDISQITCFDCKKQGHFATDCTEKSNRIFCYSCGLDDYVSSKCPRCKDKNFHKAKFPKPDT